MDAKHQDLQHKKSELQHNTDCQNLRSKPRYGNTSGANMITAFNTNNENPHLARDSGVDVKVVHATAIANKATKIPSKTR